MKLLLIIVLIPVVVLLGLALLTALAAWRVTVALPPQGQFVEVPGARLQVVDKGRGPPILLIHGLAGQLAHFTYGVVDLLAVNHRVIAVDRPGSGYSTREPGASAALGAQADVMAALLDALKVEGPVVVVGHSLGGAIALTMAQRHPGKVAGLALVAPLTHEPKGVPDAFGGLAITQPWLRRLVAWTMALPMTLLKRDEVLALVFGPETVPADFGTRGGALLGVRPSHFIAASTDLAAVPQDLAGVVAGYPAMRLPVAVLYGRGDRILNPAEQGETLVAELPGATLTLVDAGHMLPVTDPQTTARFIAELAARARP